LLVIRLSRQGRRNHPAYRLVVAENSKALDGSFVEIVGNYNPIAVGQPLVIQKERIEYWLSKGATPSNTIAKLLNRVGFNLPVVKKSKAPKQKKTRTATLAVPAKDSSGGAEETPVTVDTVSEAAAETLEQQPQEGPVGNNQANISTE